MRWIMQCTSAGLALGLLAGCRLIDQRNFGGAPHRPAPAELAQALASRGGLPLLVIRPDDNVPYGDDLSRAVGSAEARDGAARFKVIAAVPAAGDLAAQSAALTSNGDFARQVLDGMQADGITADRISLAAHTEAGLGAREIRVYLETDGSGR